MIKPTKVMLQLLAFVFCFSTNLAYAHEKDCDRQKAIAFPPVAPDVKGRGELCSSPSGLAANLKLLNLTPGHAYTVWWVYQDNPSLCSDDPSGTGGFSLTGEVSNCELLDFAGEKPLGVFGRMASGVVPRSGRLKMKGQFGGMQPSAGSEIWLWAFTHGPADLIDGAALARQLLTPEDPNAGVPHLGNFIDEQRGFPAATIVFKID